MADFSPQQISETLKDYLTEHEKAVEKYKEAVAEYENNLKLTAQDNN